MELCIQTNWIQQSLLVLFSLNNKEMLALLKQNKQFRCNTRKHQNYKLVRKPGNSAQSEPASILNHFTDSLRSETLIGIVWPKKPHGWGIYF